MQLIGSLALASASDNFVAGATIVMVLAMLAHAAEWAFIRERRTADSLAVPAQGSGREAEHDRADAAQEAAAQGAEALGSHRGAVAVLERPDGGDDATGRSERSETFRRIGIALTILATGLLGLGVISRGLAAERVPWSNLYEFAITGSFILLTTYLVTLRRLGLWFLSLPLVGFVLVVLGLAVTVLYLPVSGLIPALQSYWLVIHVSAAVTATAVFSLGAVTSLAHILKARQERRVTEAPTGVLANLPPAAAIERIAYRLHAFAFPVWTFALIAGAIWAAKAWGRYWGWDPKETWMFITWICYAAYLHARSTAGWRDKVSWIALVAFGALLFNLIGVNFLINGLHSYSGF